MPYMSESGVLCLRLVKQTAIFEVDLGDSSAIVRMDLSFNNTNDVSYYWTFTFMFLPSHTTI